MYIDKKQLKEQVKLFLDSGEIDSEFLKSLTNISFGVWRRYDCKGEPKELLSKLILVVLSKKDLLNLNKNVFSYLTQITKHLIGDGVRKKKRYDKMKYRYRIIRYGIDSSLGYEFVHSGQRRQHWNTDYTDHYDGQNIHYSD